MVKKKSSVLHYTGINIILYLNIKTPYIDFYFLFYETWKATLQFFEKTFFLCFYMNRNVKYTGNVRLFLIETYWYVDKNVLGIQFLKSPEKCYQTIGINIRAKKIYSKYRKLPLF